MKKLLYLISLGAFLSLVSCEGFLDEKNYASVSADSYYVTQNGVNSIVNATYSHLRTLFSDPTPFLAGTDLHIVYYGRSEDNPGLSRYQSLMANTGDVWTLYNNLYTAVGVSNTAVHYSEQAESFTALPRLAAEARFLRAYYYMHLVQQFGGVPLVTTMATEPAYELTRETEENVWDFIITEMGAALPNLMDRAAGSDYGRIDKRTCNFYLALAHLTRGWKSYAKSDDFSKAKSYADAAIGTMTSLTLPYAKAYSALDYGWRNDEVIWSVTYSPSSMQSSTSGSAQGAFFSGYMDGSPAGNKQTNQKFSQTLYNMWLTTKDIEDPNNDSRWDAQYEMVVFSPSFAPYKATTEAQKAQLRNETPVWGVYIPWWKPEAERWKTRADFIADYPGAADGPGAPVGSGRYKDKVSGRFRHFEAPGVDMTTATVAQLKEINRYILRDPEDGPLGMSQTANYFYPNFKKFDCWPAQEATLSGTSSYRDIDLARISEAYLIAAEACVKMNQPDLAAEYINRVRRRAIDASDGGREITAARATVDFVLEERARELFGSYIRWYDLSRTGTLMERAVRYNPDLDGEESNFVGADGNKKLLRPIPQTARDANAALTQNPGY